MHLIGILVFLPLLTSCVIFSNFQSAETVGKGQGEITPFSSSIFLFSSEESDYGQQNLGVNYAHGIDDNVDVRLQLGTMITGEYPFDLGNFGEYNMVKLGPKFQVSDGPQDIFAVNIPIGKTFDGDFESGDGIFLEPTLLYTNTKLPLKPTLGLKWIKNTESESDFIGINAGVHSPGPPVFRPEVGVLFSPGDEGVVFQFGFGLSFSTTGNEKE